MPLVRHHRDRGDPLRELEGGLDAVGDAAADALLGDETVHDHLDRVLVGLRELDGLGELADLAVDPGAGEPLAGELLQELLVFPLPPADDRREHLEPGAFRQLQHLVHDLVGRLPADRSAAVVAVGVSDPSEQHPEVVVDLRDGPDRGSGVARRRLLIDRDGRRETFDEVDVRLLHLTEELAGVRRQRLHVPALALGVDRVEGERRFPGAGQSREHDQLVTRQVQRDVLEVVLTGAVDDESLGAHGAECTGEPRHAWGRRSATRNPGA